VRRLIVVVAILAALAAAWLAVRVAAVPGTAKGTDERGTEQTERLRRTSSGPPPAETPADVDGPIDPEDAAPPVMRVVHADTGDPAPHADVRFVATNLGSWFSNPWNDVQDVLATGTKLEVDQSGRFSLPPPSQGRRVVLAARLADRWGALQFIHGGPGGGSLLRLHDCVRFRARVVDAGGKACAGVLVSFDVRGDHRGTEATSESGEAVKLVPFENWETDAPSDEHPGWVKAVLPLARDAEAQLVRHSARDYFAEIVLEPTGSVEVLLVDGLGRSPDGDVMVWLQLRRDRVAAYAKAVDGRAMFPWVGLDADLRAGAYADDEFPGSGFASVSVVFPPISVPGERRVERITVTRDRPVVTGVLVDSRGEPITGTGFGVTVLCPPGPSRFSVLLGDTKTDAEGKFRFTLDCPPRASDGAWVRISLDADDVESVEFPLPPMLRSGPNDVGRMNLVTAEVLVAGVVLGKDGEPLEGAVVSSVEDAQYVSTGDDGKFVLRGRDRDGQVHLRVRCDGFRTVRTAPYPVGKTGVTLAMRPGAGLAGSVRLPEGVHRSRISVRVRSETSSEGPESIWVEPDGAFETHDLAPGRVRVEIGFESATGPPLMAVDGLVLEQGETLRDPRLEDVDVSAELSVYRVTIVDPAGRPVWGWMYTRRSGAGADWKPELTGPNGIHDAVVPRGAMDVAVFAPGFGMARRDGVSADQRIVLQPAAKTVVELRLPRDIAILPATYQLTTHLLWKGTGAEGPAPSHVAGRFMMVRNIEFDTDGVANLTVWDPGRYEVVVWLDARDAAYSHARPTRRVQTDPEALILTVKPGDTRVTREIPIPSGTLARMLAAPR